MIVDTHCHLDRLNLDSYQGKLDLALQAAEAMAVTQFLCVCIDLEHFNDVIAIAQHYKNVHATVGVHPNENAEVTVNAEQLIKLGQSAKVVGVGETGLDYYRSEGDLQWQRERFRQHIQAAKALKKPLIVHSRQARADTINILKAEGAEEVRGIMHCFTEDWDMAKKAMDLGFYISFSGIVTFNSAKELQAIAKKIPLTSMLVETDSPYLAPVPYRGKPNEPAYVRYVVDYIAKLRDTDWQTIAEQTTKNYFELFKI